MWFPDATYPLNEMTICNFQSCFASIKVTLMGPKPIFFGFKLQTFGGIQNSPLTHAHLLWKTDDLFCVASFQFLSWCMYANWQQIAPVFIGGVFVFDHFQYSFVK